VIPSFRFTRTSANDGVVPAKIGLGGSVVSLVPKFALGRTNTDESCIVPDERGWDHSMHKRIEIDEDDLVVDEVVRHYKRLISDALTVMAVADVRALVLEMESVIAREPSN
jgi:hypothetical protein